MEKTALLYGLKGEVWGKRNILSLIIMWITSCHSVPRAPVPPTAHILFLSLVPCPVSPGTSPFLHSAFELCFHFGQMSDLTLCNGTFSV